MKPHSPFAKVLESNSLDGLSKSIDMTPQLQVPCAMDHFIQMGRMYIDDFRQGGRKVAPIGAKNCGGGLTQDDRRVVPRDHHVGAKPPDPLPLLEELLPLGP